MKLKAIGVIVLAFVLVFGLFSALQAQDPVYFTRVQETTSTTGTGAYALGGALTGYQAFSVVGNGGTCYYVVVAVDTAGNPTGAWEEGLGTYNSGSNTLARTTVLASTNAGSAVNWTTGTKRIFLTLPSQRGVTNALLYDAVQATIKCRPSGAGTGVPSDCTGTQVTAILDAFTSGAKGLAPASGGGATNFLRADGTWAAPTGTIGGSIAATQVAFATGSNTVGGEAAFTYDSGSNLLKFVTGAGVSFAGLGTNPILLKGGDVFGSITAVEVTSADSYIVFDFDSYTDLFVPDEQAIGINGGGLVVNGQSDNGSNGRYAVYASGASEAAHSAQLVNGGVFIANVAHDAAVAQGIGGAVNITAGTIANAYSAHNEVNLSNASVVSGTVWDARNIVVIGGTSTVANVMGTDFSLTKAGGATITNAYAYWSEDLMAKATNPYFLWYDGGAGADCNSGGVYRVNQFGITALYNPCFAKYTPGATNFERLLSRWGDTGVFGTDNVAYLGLEVGGSGTNRNLTLLGAGVTLEATPGTSTYLAMSEISAPSAPAANGVRIYTEDNGAGKTRVCALFNSGAAQCFATQP